MIMSVINLTQENLKAFDMKVLNLNLNVEEAKTTLLELAKDMPHFFAAVHMLKMAADYGQSADYLEISGIPENMEIIPYGSKVFGSIMDEAGIDKNDFASKYLCLSTAFRKGERAAELGAILITIWANEGRCRGWCDNLNVNAAWEDLKKMRETFWVQQQNTQHIRTLLCMLRDEDPEYVNATKLANMPRDSFAPIT